MRKQPPRGNLDTSGTRYRFEVMSDNVEVLKGHRGLLENEGLLTFDDFMTMRGVVVDKNRRSLVQRVMLGPSNRVFYLKQHRNYIKRRLRNVYRSRPVILGELSNIMHYARAGLDRLEPAAWGWRTAPGGKQGFLLLEELEGYRSLDEWIGTEAFKNNPRIRRAIRNAAAVMLRQMHEAGIAHVDLFSWHVFLKETPEGFTAQPIDLERSRVETGSFRSRAKIRQKKAQDLAALHLTVPWPEVGSGERLRFFLTYRSHDRLTSRDREFLKLALRSARRRASRSKFKSFGVAPELLRKT